VSTDLGVDSLVSRFPFRARTDRQKDGVTEATRRSIHTGGIGRYMQAQSVWINSV